MFSELSAGASDLIMPYNILLIDDDADFRNEFREFFRGYRIIEASRGEEALSILKRPHEIDLVILDVMLPGSRGTDVLKKIKEIDPDLSVIILTGYGSKNIVIEALKGDAANYLEKPIDTEKAGSIIENLLDACVGKANLDTSDSQGKIERIKLFLDRNWHKKVTLDDVASLVCLSPKYVSRIFKEMTGRSFNEYKLQLKVDQAKEWLEKTGHSVDKIAYSLGYLNAESFIRIFKKFAGQTPTEYRNRRSPARYKSRRSHGQRKKSKG